MQTAPSLVAARMALVVLGATIAGAGCGGGETSKDAGGNPDGGTDTGLAGPKYGWARRLGSTESEGANGIAAASDKTFVITGSFGGTVDFDTTDSVDARTAKDKQDVFIVKMDHAGDFHWSRTFGGGSGVDRGIAVAVASDGSVFATGSFHGTVDLAADPKMPGTDVHVAEMGTADAWVVRLTQDGKFVWARTFGGPGGDEEGRGIAVAGDGSVVVTGLFHDGADFDPGAGADKRASAGGADGFVLRLGGDGRFVSVSTFGGTGEDRGTGVAAGGGDGSTLVTGWFDGTADFAGDKRTSAGLTDAFAARFAADGSLAWLRSWGGPGADTAQAVSVAMGGSVFVAGSFAGSADLDPGPGAETHDSAGRQDAYVLRMGGDGSFAWARTFGGVDDEQAAGVAAGILGDVFLLGRFKGRVDFDPGASADAFDSLGNFPDVFVTGLGGDGEYRWTRAFDADFEDLGQGLAQLSDASVVFTGWFETSVDFDPGPRIDNLVSQGDWDVFVARLVPSM